MNLVSIFSKVRDLIRYDKRFMFGFFGVVLIIFLIIVSFFSPYKEGSTYNVPKDKPPSLEYPFGTNSRGQDLFWNMSVALRNSFIFGLLTALISRIVAIFIGLTAGYKGGIWDRFLMTINDSLVVVPGLPIFILLSFIIAGKMNIFLLAIILGLIKGWAWDSRIIRSEVLSLKERAFTNTAIFSGMSDYAIIFKEHFPFVLPIIFATAINNIIWAIGMEVTLSILGLTDIQTPTIGVSIYWLQQHQAIMLGIWWWILIPIGVSIILILSLYLLSVSLDDYLDPRTRLKRIGKGV